MAWISLTLDDVKTRISWPELEAYQTWHLAAGQVDPTTETISGVVREIRGRVAACSRNTLGADGTIPEELYHAALTLIQWRLAMRLPGAGVDLLDEGRKTEHSEAQKLLRDVAKCEFAVVQPAAHSCTPDSNNANPAGRYGGTTAVTF